MILVAICTEVAHYIKSLCNLFQINHFIKQSLKCIFKSKVSITITLMSAYPESSISNIDTNLKSLKKGISHNDSHRSPLLDEEMWYIYTIDHTLTWIKKCGTFT